MPRRHEIQSLQAMAKRSGRGFEALEVLIDVEAFAQHTEASKHLEAASGELISALFVGEIMLEKSHTYIAHIYIYIYMIIYDYIWLYMIIYDYIWLYMIIYDYIWLYMIIYDYIWLYMIIYDYIWLYMIIYDYIWFYMYTGMYAYVHINISTVYKYKCISSIHILTWNHHRRHLGKSKSITFDDLKLPTIHTHTGNHQRFHWPLELLGIQTIPSGKLT